MMALYRALLRLYPASFRAEYGEEMCSIFAGRRRDATGLFPTLGLWLAALEDIAVNAVRVHGDILRQDLAFIARTLRRSRGFALTAVAVAALGIGATTAAFSITDHVLFRPLPFAKPDRLVRLWQNQGGYGHTELSPANYRDWKRMSRSFEEMGAFGGQAYNLAGDGEPERVEGRWLTGEVFRILGVRPALGRVFGPEADAPDAPATIVLGYGLWQARFGGEASVLGRQVLVDGAPHVVIGVMPASFHFPNRDVQLWIAKTFVDADFADRTDTYVYGVARLNRDISLEQARAEMRLVAAQLERAFPNENARTSATVDRLRDELSPEARLLPLALLGAAACVLLIACTNLTHLLLARAMVRRKELAVRAALGAGRERLMRQLLTESLVLALVGGALGVLIAASAAPVLARLVPHSLPIAEAPPMDLRVLAFALVLTAGTGIAFGVLPASRAGHAGVSGLQEGARGGVGGRRERARSTLVVAEVTASVVLLVCCGLLLRALWRVQSVDPGFSANGVLTLRTALPQPRYASTATRAQFYARVLSEVRALPGVSDAAYVSGLPMVMRGGIWGLVVPGEAQEPGAQPPASARFVTPGFFATLGIPLRSGRDFRDSDTREAPFVAVVSESLAERHWPGQDPIGRRFRFGGADRTVVGVVGDIRVRGLERTSEPQVYLAHQQVADSSIIGYTPKDLAFRASGPPLDLLPSVRSIIHRADPQQPISDVRLLSDIVEGETAPRRIQVRVLAAFAAVAFFLAAIGLHGVLSFAVTSRAPEIGVRIALGARSADILSMVLREALQMAAVGLGLGLLLAYIAGRGMEALLAGVRPADAATFLAATGLSALMTLAGSLLPAVRAVHVNPVDVMRLE
ncbi:MAG: permease [Acidobacteria bacterium]|nr:MAG: permease [Acidobacteriota bacterium]